MKLSADPLDFSPPRGARWRGPLLLALGVHALLVVALTWGVNWQQDAPAAGVAAELWSALPAAAAPRAVEPEPVAPPPEPEPESLPPQRVEPARPPVSQAVDKPAPKLDAGPSEAQIALQRKQEEDKRRQQELEQRELELRKQQEQRKKDELRKKEDARKEAEKRETERKKREAEEKKREEQAARDKAAKDKAAKDRAARDKAEAAQIEAERKKQLARMMGQAGGSGDANAKGSGSGGSGSGSASGAGSGASNGAGSGAGGSGASAGYGAKVAARIKTFYNAPEQFPSNLTAEAEIRTLPDGTILSQRLLKSSGNEAFDETVLRAIDRAGRLPKDDNGRMPDTTFVIKFKP